MSQIDIEKRVAQYIALRDKIKQLDDAHKERMKPFKETLEILNSDLLGHLNAINANNAATNAGTVYRTEKKSASIADGKAFMDYVLANQDFDLLDKKVNVTAVGDHIDKHGHPPPGINFNSRYEVGVRRPTHKSN